MYFRAILYINDGYEGGYFFFAHKNNTIQVSCKQYYYYYYLYSYSSLHNIVKQIMQEVMQ